MKQEDITKSLLSNTVIQSDPDQQRIEMMIKEVFNKKNIDVKTDINARQIVAITKGRLYASMFKSTLMADLCTTFMNLNLSRDRKSRKEFVELVKWHNTEQLNQRPTIADRLLGRSM